MIREVILKALKDAAREGYHNREVVDYIEPRDATGSPFLTIVTRPIPPIDATESHPYD